MTSDMNSPAWHPDEEQLFDLIEGQLDDATERRVAAHLDWCASCAALAEAGLAGANALDGVVHPMPRAAANGLHAALAVEWDARAGEAQSLADVAEAGSRDAEAAPAATTVESAGPVTPTLPARAPRRYRWFAPALAAAVLAALAGTSIWIGADPSFRSGAHADSTAIAPDGGAEGGAAAGGSVAAPMAKEAKTAADATSAAPATPPTADGDYATGSATDVQVTVEPRGDTVDRELGADTGSVADTCIASRDPAHLLLPDGSIPTRVAAGPFGIYVACG